MKKTAPLLLALMLGLCGIASATDRSARIVPVIEGGYTLDSPEFQRLYGPGVFNMNSLANTIIGAARGYESVISIRFLALNSGPLSFIQFFQAAGIGYANGTGGKILIRVYPDDGTARHLPDVKQKPLASTVYKPHVPALRRKQGFYPKIEFTDGSGSLQAGRLYHMVMTNQDENPDKNFSSINHAATRFENGRPARWLNTRDWAVLHATRNYKSSTPFKWSNLTEKGSSGNYFSPILQIGYADGQSQGVSDMESGSVDPQRIYRASNPKPLREHFMPSSERTVSGFSVATASSTGGKLGWKIMQGDTVLAEGSINQPKANYEPLTSNTGIQLAKMVWYDIPLPKNIVMKAGQSYDLQFTPEGDSEWIFGDHTNGARVGFTWPAAFTESQAQNLRKGKWLDSYHWNYSRSAKGSNWPVVLHTAR